MRKLKFACRESQGHHALAACAITEVGLTKGFAHGEGITRHVAESGDGWRVDEGRYHAMPTTEGRIEVWTTTDVGCRVWWTFSWPDLKLYGYTLDECNCGEIDPQLH
uniref:Uncharacterized protein n=1 Tax=uncultured prokaryote TaxID=198431 RepID=A0A0H5Q1D8_9ZZZZ|nr:hypothetical protein [uncultured prokaryote]